MKRKKLILSVLLVLMAVGFAAVSTTLYINGITTIDKDDDNFVSGVVFDEESLSQTEGVEANISESGRTITFTTQEMSALNDAATVNFKIKNYSQYNAELGTPAIRCYFVDDFAEDTKSVEKTTTNDYVTVVPGNEIDGATITAGGGLSDESHVTVTQIKSYAGTADNNDPLEIKFQCEIVVAAKESTTAGIEKPVKDTKVWTAVTGDGTHVGDEIAVGEEHFYVISNDGTTLNALAKNNLNAGNMCTSSSSCTPIENPTYKQDEAMTGVVGNGSWSYGHGSLAFSNTNGWSYSNNDTIDIQAYDGPVKYALNAYKAILPEGIEVRLITKAEIEALVNDGATLSYGSIKDKADAKGISWLYSTSYWSGSAVADYADRVWSVHSYGRFDRGTFDIGRGYGLRPVISLES